MNEATLFREALSRPPAERAAFLAHACAGRPELRAAVEALLAAHERPVPGEGAPQPDEPPAPPVKTTDYEPAAETATVVAGRYTLVEKVGEGGMGEVWVAKQTEPVKRKVALKLIKAGMDTRAVLQRFEQERQALALMDHPNIARVIDAGMTAERRPFFVMELVNGPPLTRFCDEAKLGVRQRLELFVPICQAVQHAHQKGVIHRDLKPSNILVTVIDGRPVPKVIDFGLAKATAGRLTDESVSTQFGAAVGTLEYMAPEQAGASGEDIDTRADVYSLGVILYELLTGLRPIDGRRLKKAAFTEMVRILKEEEPSRPSARLSSDASAPSLSALRQIEPKKLVALLRGELDWVVMKCLEKQRARRYETANGLARDIQRYLADEVVEARPPSAGYRLRKFVSRNRGRVAAAGLLLLALVAGIAGTTWGLIQAAKKNAELADEQAKVQARFELAQKAIATFHTGVSKDVLLKNDQFKELRTRLLKEAANFYSDLEKLLAGQTDAKSRKALAAAYFELGQLTEKIGSKPEALAVHRKALAIRRELAAAAGADVETRLDVARSLFEVGRLLGATGDTAGARGAYQEQRDIAAALEAESPTDAVRTVLASSHDILGLLLSQTGKPGAEAEYRQALAIFQKLADDKPAVAEFRNKLANSHTYLGWLLSNTGKPGEAEAEYRQALAILQKLADDNPAVTAIRRRLAESHNNLGRLLTRQGRFAEAFAALDAGLALRQKLAHDDPKTPMYVSYLGSSYAFRGGARVRAGQPAEAAADLRRALGLWSRDKAPDPEPRFERARALALLAGLGADAKSGVTAAEASTFAGQAAAALRDAVSAGWAQRDELKEPDFDPLRQRADFKKLRAELEKKAAGESRKKP